MLYNGRHAKSEKVGGWVSSRSGWLLELLMELTNRNKQNWIMFMLGSRLARTIVLMNLDVTVQPVISCEGS